MVRGAALQDYSVALGETIFVGAALAAIIAAKAAPTNDFCNSALKNCKGTESYPGGTGVATSSLTFR